jgi:phosphate starvation-inducible PhoH-like protein
MSKSNISRTTSVSKVTNVKENVEERAIKFVCNEEQKDIVKRSYNDAISIFIGKPGSGKTALGAYIAMTEMIKKNNGISKIVITRPTVSDEQLGFLPGDLKEKLDPWLQPIYHNMYQCLPKQKVTKMIEDGDIEISPIAFLRGRTINGIILADEIQNLTIKQMEMLVTRLGKNGRMILCGDISQVDLKNKKDSGLQFLINMVKDIEGINVYEFKTNHRHPILDKLLERFNNPGE